jgi:hypothetical protein
MWANWAVSDLTDSQISICEVIRNRLTHQGIQHQPPPEYKLIAVTNISEMRAVSNKIQMSSQWEQNSNESIFPQ